METVIEIDLTRVLPTALSLTFLGFEEGEE